MKLSVSPSSLILFGIFLTQGDISEEYALDRPFYLQPFHFDSVNLFHPRVDLPVFSYFSY
jgi:hypothetical protein